MIIKFFKSAVRPIAIAVSLLLPAVAIHAATVKVTVDGITYTSIEDLTKDSTDGIAKVTDGRTVSGAVTIKDKVDMPVRYYDSEIRDYVTKYIECKVVKIENGAFSGNKAITSVTMPAVLNTIGYGAFQNCIALQKVSVWYVSTIGNRAFNGCTALTALTMPEALETIGDYAFEGCTSLQTLKLNKGLTKIGISAFKGCEKIALGGTLLIPSTVITMGTDAFNGIGAEGVVFDFENGKTKLKKVANNAFYKCNNLRTVDFAEGIDTIGNRAFYQCKNLGNPNSRMITIPSSVKAIGQNAFRECNLYEGLIFNEGLDSIAFGAFYKTKLRTLVFPSSLKYIGTLYTGQNFYYGAFQECKDLTSVTFKEGLQKIHHQSFQKCEKLERVDLPFSLDEINGLKDYAFDHCLALVIVTEAKTKKVSTRKYTFAYTPVKKTGILKRVNDELDGENKIQEQESGSKRALRRASGNDTGRIIGESSFYMCQNMTGVPDGIDSIGPNAFGQCISLTEVEFPAGMTEVPAAAFAWTGISSMVLPHTVVKIGRRAFESCDKLTSINIPPRVHVIEDQTFYACSLKEIAIPNAVRSIGRMAFSGNDFSELVLPDSLRTIGEEAFRSCRNVSTIVIPDSVTSIGARAFEDVGGSMGGLFSGMGRPELTFGTPGLLKNPLPVPMIIREEAFGGTSYSTVTSYHTVPPTLIPNVVSETDIRYTFVGSTYENAVLKVPEGTADAYREAVGWSLFRNIEEMPSASVAEIEAGRGVDVVVTPDGSIVVAGNVPVTVYGIDGRMVWQGSSERPVVGLPRGLYIVSVPGASRKVRI